MRFSVQLSATIAAYGLVLAPAVQAQALAKPGCEPQLVVSTMPFEPVEDFSKSFSGIEALTQQSEHALTRAGQGVGATRVAISATNKTTTDPQGCSVLNIAVGYAKPVVYVASDLTPNQCAHDHVLEHERHHVEMYRESLETLAERTKNVLTAQLAAAYANPDPTKGVHILLEAAMDEAATVMPRHNAFDSDEEYERNESACEGAIKSIFKRWQRRNR